MGEGKTALWWVRRDLRLTDNQALDAALAQAEQVIPVFVLDPTLLRRYHAAEKRVAFLMEGLRQLDADLRDRGSRGRTDNVRLIVRRGDPPAVLAQLVEETGAQAIFAEEDFSPYARARDNQVAQRMPLHLLGGVVVHPPGSVRKADGDPYVVYTPFKRKWKALSLPGARDILPPPRHIATPADVASQPIPAEPTLPDSTPFPAGETEAQRRLRAFTGGEAPPIYRYAETRNRMDLDATSRLSPYLRFGMISARQAVVSALAARDVAQNPQAREGADVWLDELIWREFYVHILHHFPHVLERSFRANWQNIPWKNDEQDFEAWCKGRTGYPVVDAAMRQLTHSGWMHNRARMIAASFLVKDLLIDWRRGEDFFMTHLVDGDPAANNGGWQWTAGTGASAAPYFRIFNPISQGQQHDPDGDYVRRWIPALKNAPERFIHHPWDMTPEAQREAGCVIGRDYPAPIVEHAQARERALVAYAQAKDQAKN